MKNAFALDNLRQIRHTFSRYLSILIITALGVSFFSGLGATGSAMRQTAEDYLNGANFMDLRILSTVGFNGEDMATLLEAPGIGMAEGVYTADVVCEIGQKNYSFLLMSVPQNLNMPLITEGRMPKGAAECVVDIALINGGVCKIGDTLKFSSGNSDPIEDIIKRDTYTVVGAVENPLYMSADRGQSRVGSGASDGFVMIPAEDFSLEVFTEVYVGADVSKSSSRFSDEYLKSLKPLKENLEDIGLTRSGARYADITRDIRNEIADAKTEIADGYTELEDARKELSDGRKELDDGYQEYYDNKAKFEQEINDAQQKLDDGYAQYREGLQQYQEGYAEFSRQEAEAEAKLKPAEERLNAAREEYESGMAELRKVRQLRDAISGYMAMGSDPLAVAGMSKLAEQTAGENPELSRALSAYAMAPLNPTAKSAVEGAVKSMSLSLTENEPKLQETETRIRQGQAEIDSSRAQLNEGRAKLEASKAELDAAKQTLDDGQRELEDGKTTGERELSDAWLKLIDGENEWKDGEKEFKDKEADALIDLKDAEKKVMDAEAELADFDMPEWYVLDNEANVGFMSYKQDTGRLDVLGIVIPIFFFMVAVFVTMTSMTRLVESERGFIGTVKSIGYSRWKIASRYLYYALSASAIGGIIGAVAGIYLFPAVIFDAYGQMYTLPPLKFSFPLGLTALSVLLAMVCAAFPAFFVCLATVREAPAMLMRPEAPKAGQRVFVERLKWFWNRLTFSQKVSMRNLFRYKKRFLMTLIGVSGCTALMFLGFALKDSIVTILPRQYGGIIKYDLRVGFNADDGELADITAFEGVKDGAIVYGKSVDATSGGSLRATTLIVPEEPDKFNNFLDMKDYKTKQPLNLGKDTVIIAEKLAKLLELNPGDEFKLRDSDGVEIPVKLGAIMENYLDHFVIMPPELYKSVVGTYPEYNQGYYITSVNGESQDALLRDIMELDGVSGVSSVSETKGLIENMLEALQFVDFILVACAGILLFVVQFSLISINIEERVRELATIKVLGFTDRELASYIFRESNMLVVLGSVLGLFVGVGLQRFVISTMETNSMIFSRDLLWPSFVWSFCLTVVFALIIDAIMIPHIKKIDMISSLKSVE